MSPAKPDEFFMRLSHKVKYLTCTSLHLCAEADAEKSGVKLTYKSSNMSYADFLAKYDCE